jgi:hypothetical protein
VEQSITAGVKEGARIDTAHKDFSIRSSPVPSAALQPQEVSYPKAFAKLCTLLEKKMKAKTPPNLPRLFFWLLCPR